MEANLTMSNISSNESTPIYCSADFKHIAEEYSTIHGYISLIVCHFGSVANVINIAVLSRKEMRSPTNAILTGLAIADLLVMLDYIPYACHMYLSPADRIDKDRFSFEWSTFVLFHSLFSQVCHTISICLTLILAIWRYIAVVYPHKNKDLCQMKNTLLALLIAYVLGPIVCVPLYLAIGVESKEEWLDSSGKQVERRDNISSTCTNCTKATLYYVDFNEWAMKNNELHKKTNFWIYSVVIKLLPCVALTLLSTRLIIALLETKKRREALMGSSIPLQVRAVENADSLVKQQKPKKNVKQMDKEKQTDRTTRMLLAVLLLFLLTEFPQGILGLLSAIFGKPFFKQCYMPLGKSFSTLR